ncbi:MAG: TolC family protein [candidate division KSB1 bacterium]|nr:TolC family protein [candidate division KSB1 bacterium]
MRSKNWFQLRHARDYGISLNFLKFVAMIPDRIGLSLIIGLHWLIHLRFSLVLVTSLLIFKSEIMFAQHIDSLVAEAVRNNPQLRSLDYQVAATQFRAQSVRSLPPPTLGLEFSQVPINEFNVWNKALSNSVSLSQMFHLGGKLKAMTMVEQQNAVIAQNDREIFRLNLIGQVKMSYYQLWLIERKIELQQHQLELLNQLQSSLNLGYQLNRVNQADLLTLKSEIAAENLQLITLQNQRDVEQYRLNQLLGRELESKTVYTVKALPVDSLAITQTALQQQLAQFNPELQRMSNMLAMNQAMLKANNKEAVPDLMIGAMVMRMPRGMILTSESDLSMLEMKTETMYSLMASVTLPFLPWSAKKYRVKSQELAAAIKTIEYGKIEMEREMLVRLKEALVKLKTATDQVRLYADQVLPLYRQAAAAQVSAYQNNQANISAVIDNYRMLLMQEMNYYMAQADYQMAKAEIEMMVGAVW